jgi:hypothetical protein
MDVVLIILGILGFSAIVISIYVFTVAARNYVSDDHDKYRNLRKRAARNEQIKRSPFDRRSHQAVDFPLTVNGLLITHDRRHHSDRRKAA